MPNTPIIEADDYTVWAEPVAPAARGEMRRAERAAVLSLLHRALGAEARLEHTPQGAPYVVGAPPISVSHGAGVALLAVAARPGLAIGVDVESDRPQLQRVAGRFVTSADSPALTLLELWTAKEAAFKALAQDAGRALMLADITVAPRGAAVTATACGLTAAITYHDIKNCLIAVALRQS